MNWACWARCLLLMLRIGLPALGQAQGLVLHESEGERRVRRPRPTPNRVGLGAFIIKVDDKNGGSSDFFMGYEDIPPGAAIPPHYHPHSDEILFIQRGTGLALLGARKGPVRPGSTVYIPQRTQVSLRNTGPDTIAVGFIFPGEGIGQYLRATSVAEGDSLIPLSAGEIAAIREKYHAEITFDSAVAGMNGGLILSATEGEHRIRRPPPGSVTTLRTPYIIKIDSRNGGSPDFFMGYEDIAPGDRIAPHHHPFADEILFIHRGSGVATIGRRERAVNPGTTIYIPRDTRASLRNTGADKMTIAFIFARPGIEQYFRETSVAQGQPARPFSAEEFAAVRRRHREHVTFDGP